MVFVCASRMRAMKETLLARISIPHPADVAEPVPTNIEYATVTTGVFDANGLIEMGS